ncbi:MAG: hypothetical protein K9N52_03865 [Verrucomicrobia bacterium]|nr:hypothetical protein [Verrucomicrobiota bacterium]
MTNMIIAIIPGTIASFQRFLASKKIVSMISITQINAIGWARGEKNFNTEPIIRSPFYYGPKAWNKLYQSMKQDEEG